MEKVKSSGSSRLSGMWKIYCRTTAFSSLSGNKHTAAIARLKQKDRPGKQSLIGESSATSFSGPSKFATFATDLCKASVSAIIIVVT
jgi:hypothetical protein